MKIRIPLRREKEEKAPIYGIKFEPEPKCPPDGAKCPLCSEGRLYRIKSIMIGGTHWEIFPELGCIYECDVCGNYFRYNPDKGVYEKTSYLDIVRQMKDIIAFLNVAREYKPEILFHRPISPDLAALTYADPETGEYWTVDEIIEACEALGIDPATATHRHTAWIVAWLREHYPRRKKF